MCLSSGGLTIDVLLSMALQIIKELKNGNAF